MFDLPFRWQDFLDILIVATVLYRLLLLLADTRAMQLVKGVLIIAVVAAGANVLEFKTLSWILSKLLSVLFIAIPIVFQPEIRRILEELGRGRLFRIREEEERPAQLADELTRTLLFLAGRRIGAILVLQRRTGLKDIWRSAVPVRGQISQELLVSIFWPGTPLHDGAAILDREQVLAAACYLPLTEKSDLSRWFGTRHRAALGVTEVSDALALVVSEERGEVALAVNGHLSRNLREEPLRKLLQHYFASGEREGSFLERLKEELRTPLDGENDHEG